MKLGKSIRGLSIRRTIVFWWGLFLTIQQAERLFLLPETVALEPPTPALIANTLLVGLRADLIVATMAVALTCLLALTIRERTPQRPRRLQRALG